MIFDRIVHGSILWEKQSQKRLEDPDYLEGYGYKVYSQSDEDGVIAEIFRRIGTESKTFIEFGVQNGLECNSHYLLHCGWKGLWIEGDYEYCKEIRIRFKTVVEAGILKLQNSFVTRDNINQLLKEFVGSEEKNAIDFLSIDIDGNDYYVWKAIECISPRCVCIEYNGKFPPDHEWIQAYNPMHCWDGSDWHGASLKSLELLGKEKEYALVGTNLTGSNAFFVRNDLVDGKFKAPYIAEALFNPSFNMGLKFQSNYPAKYCLVGQKEYLGIHNYITSPAELKVILNAEAKKRGVNKIHFFPFDKVEEGAAIALWGGGQVGRAYVDQVDILKYCRIEYIIDEYTTGKKYKDIPIVRFDSVTKKVDKLIIAIEDKNIAMGIKKKLLNNGISVDKIIWEL